MFHFQCSQLARNLHWWVSVLIVFKLRWYIQLPVFFRNYYLPFNSRMSPEMMSVTHNPNATNWNLEDGYDDKNANGVETHPFRVFGAGAKAGLSASLKLPGENLEYFCSGPVQGFKILLHNPGEVPQLSKQYFRVPLQQEVLISVKPNVISTSEGLRYYAPNRRQCFFDSERQLRFFKIYTQQNCELECLSNFTKQECGCVKFSMPSKLPIAISINKPHFFM